MLCERCQHEILAGDIPIPPTLTRADIEALPFVRVAQILDIPNGAGVYFAFNSEHIFYIGQSGQLAVRWRNHPYLDRLRLESEPRIAWIEIADKAERCLFEKAAIRQFKPRWNKGGADYYSDWADLREHMADRFVKARTSWAFNPGLYEMAQC